MKVDAELAVTHLSAASPWRPASIVLQGVAVLFAGDLDRAEAIFEQAAEAAVAGGARSGPASWRAPSARSWRWSGVSSRGGDGAELARSFIDDAPSADMR